MRERLLLPIALRKAAEGRWRLGHFPGSVPSAGAARLQESCGSPHRALSQAAGCTSPLNRCSIYESKAAGDRFRSMLEMGLSHPWQDALEKIAGTREMDATAILDYFAPLQKWLDQQNQGKPVGWYQLSAIG